MIPNATLTPRRHPACRSQDDVNSLIPPLATMSLGALQDSPLALVDLNVDKSRSTTNTASDLKLAAPECQTHFIAEFVFNTPKIPYEEAKDLIRFHVFDEKIGCRAPEQVINFLLATATFEVSLENGKKIVFKATKATAQSSIGRNDSKYAMYRATVKTPLYDTTPDAQLIKTFEVACKNCHMEDVQIGQKKDPVSGANTGAFGVKFTPGALFNFFECEALTKILLESGNAAVANAEATLKALQAALR